MASEAARQQKQNERQAREGYLRGRAEEAEARTDAVNQRIQDLDRILAAALSTPSPMVDFARTKKPIPVIALNLGQDARAEPTPTWEQFKPPPSKALGKLLRGDARIARQQTEARQAFEQELARHTATEAARQQRVQAAQQQHAQQQAAAEAEVAAQHAKVDQFAAGVRAGERHAVSRYFQYLLNKLPDPPGFPRQRRAGYVPESTLLAIEWRLPNVDVVPADKQFR
jgi:restriction system protein